MINLIFQFVTECSLQSDFDVESARICNEENILCTDEGCEKRIYVADLLCCNAPGCGLTVSDSSFTFSLLNLQWTY